MTTDDTDDNDFYIEPYDEASPIAGAWLVHHGRPPSICVAVCPHRDEAVAQAISLAAVQRAQGRASVVYLRTGAYGEWQVLTAGQP